MLSSSLSLSTRSFSTWSSSDSLAWRKERDHMNQHDILVFVADVCVLEH